MMKKIMFLIISFACIPIALVYAQTQDQKLRGGFSIGPYDPPTQDNGSLIYEAKPGTQINDTILIQSYEPESIHLYLYPADGFYNQQNTLSFTSYDQVKDDGIVKKWVTLSETEIDLLPGGNRQQEIIIKIPDDVELNKYVGGIMLEKRVPSIENPGIIIATRSAMPVIITVTDNPQHIERFSDWYAKNRRTTQVPSVYLIVSIVLFLGSIGYFFFARNKEKKGHK